MTATVTPLTERRPGTRVCADCGSPIVGRAVVSKATGNTFCHDLLACLARKRAGAPGLRVGDPVLVTTIARDLPGVVSGFIAGGIGEDFQRVNVTTLAGNRLVGCHPSCVRPNPPVVA